MGDGPCSSGQPRQGRHWKVAPGANPGKQSTTRRTPAGVVRARRLTGEARRTQDLIGTAGARSASGLLSTPAGVLKPASPTPGGTRGYFPVSPLPGLPGRPPATHHGHTEIFVRGCLAASPYYLPMSDQLTARVFVVGDNIDTDQIIPAQYLTLLPTIPEEYAQLGSFAMVGLPEHLYPAKFITPGTQRTEYAVIVAGKNFGCGSSREHAPIALGAAGVRAVIAQTYARIFFRNSVATGEVFPYESVDRLCEVLKTGDEVTLGLHQRDTVIHQRHGLRAQAAGRGAPRRGSGRHLRLRAPDGHDPGRRRRCGCLSIDAQGPRCGRCGLRVAGGGLRVAGCGLRVAGKSWFRFARITGQMFGQGVCTRIMPPGKSFPRRG